MHGDHQGQIDAKHESERAELFRGRPIKKPNQPSTPQHQPCRVLHLDLILDEGHRSEVNVLFAECIVMEPFQRRPVPVHLPQEIGRGQRQRNRRPHQDPPAPQHSPLGTQHYPHTHRDQKERNIPFVLNAEASQDPDPHPA